MIQIRTQTISFSDFVINLHVPEDQTEETGEHISFWFGLTSSALALSRYMVAVNKFQGQSVLELGCGLGLSGIVAAKLGATVAFSDYKREALNFAQINAQMNGVKNASFLELDWENPSPPMQFDCILGSEIVYDSFFHSSLMTILDSWIVPHGKILIADRPRRVVDVFLGRMREQGYSCIESRQLIRDEGFYQQETAIYRLDRIWAI